MEYIPQLGNRRITVTTKRFYGDHVEILEWLEMPMKMLFKWEWYFRYRAALLQVKYPRYHVELEMWNTNAEGRSLAKIQTEQNQKRMIVCKRQVTKIRNKLIKYYEYQQTLIIPDYSSSFYIKAMDKYFRYLYELHDLRVWSQLNSELNESQKASV